MMSQKYERYERYFESHHFNLNGQMLERCSSEKNSIRRVVARNLEPFVAKHFFGVNLSGSSVDYLNNGLSLTCKKKINLISRVIEAKLHKNSLSLEEHADLTTLSARFHSVLSQLNRSHSSSCKRIKRDNATKSDYHRLLRAHVGDSLYEQLQATSREHEILRQSICFNAIKDRQDRSLEETDQVCAEDMVPKVLHKLFFNNRLLKALGALNVTTEFIELRRVTQPDWQGLLNEANSVKDGVKQVKKVLQKGFSCAFSSR